MRNYIQLVLRWKEIVDVIEFFIVSYQFRALLFRIVMQFCNLHRNPFEERIINSVLKHEDFEISRVLKLDNVVVIESFLGHFVDVDVLSRI